MSFIVFCLVLLLQSKYYILNGQFLFLTALHNLCITNVQTLNTPFDLSQYFILLTTLLGNKSNSEGSGVQVPLGAAGGAGLV